MLVMAWSSDQAPDAMQGQPRRAQVHVVYLSDWKRWNQDPPLARSYLRVSSGGESICLEIPAYLGPFRSKQLF